MCFGRGILIMLCNGYLYFIKCFIKSFIFFLISFILDLWFIKIKIYINILEIGYLC